MILTMILTLSIAGAGVYSLTMTDYPSVGRYRFSVTVTDNDGQAYLRRPGASGPGGEGIRTPAPRFRRTVPGPVVHLASVPAEDVVPPGQCSNLAISAVDNQEQCHTAGTGAFLDIFS